jgi:hypothetical protein
MKPESIIRKLASNQLVFQHLLINIPGEAETFISNEGEWCLLEVVCHLLDEEVEDFRARVKSILSDANAPLKAISPEKWPKERNYMEQDFKTVVSQFLEERANSVQWLTSLRNPNWAESVDHPEVGPRSAKKFLTNWLAHDYHHIRQINRIHHAYLKFSSGDDLTYAGKW